MFIVLVCTGVMFASMAWLETFCILIGGTINNSIYSATTGPHSYAAFVFGACMYFIAALVTL